MPAGRPSLAHAGTLYAFANDFYWDLRRLDEGRPYMRIDRARFETIEREVDKRLERGRKLRVFAHQHDAIRRLVDDEIQDGRLEPTNREQRVRALVENQQHLNRHWFLRVKAEESTTVEQIPGKPAVVDALLEARTADRIRKICADAFP